MGPMSSTAPATTAETTRIDPTPAGKFNVMVRLADGWLYVGTCRNQAVAERKAAAWRANRSVAR